MQAIVQKMIEDWKEDPDEEAIQRREAVWRGLSSEEQKIWKYVMRETLARREKLMLEFAYPLQFVLNTEKDIGLCRHPGDLLGSMRDAIGEGVLEHQRAFEAMLLFDLTWLQMLWEQHDPFDQVLTDVRRMSELVIKHVFQPGSTDFTVYSCHDTRPGKHLRCTSFSLEAPLVHTEGILHQTVMRMRMLLNGEFCFFDWRAKNLFATAMKMLKQVMEEDPARRKPDPYHVADRRGLVLFVDSLETARETAESILCVVTEEAKGTARIVGDNLHSNGAERKDPNNPDSSPHFRAIEIEAVLLEQGRRIVYEIQIRTLQDHLSSCYSVNGENHGLYRLDQCLKTYFPKVHFPYRVYGQDWDNPSLKKQLRRLKMATIGLAGGLLPEIEEMAILTSWKETPAMPARA